ncbi:M3 family oligoendopeptidase [Oceanobacillus sojae]|uniref:M3 family oligoendopeptidase n=1 Tax=Oceanobacillus sojae TaxID=582851 RepID=UPI0009888FFD|nr:M3 family oligoendopeptidase [Oceanobacillus sojae]
MTGTKYEQVWNLDNLFPGGSESPSFDSYVKQLELEINGLEEKLNLFGNLIEINESLRLESVIKNIGDIQEKLSQANSFITCLTAQNTKDQGAVVLREVISVMNARFESVIKKFQHIILETDEDNWTEIIETKALAECRFVLIVWREKAKMLLSEKEEMLISDLMMDGYHAWRQFYNSLIGRIKINVPFGEESKELSVGQTFNLRSHSNEDIRKAAHIALEEALQEKEELFAQILNNIAGFRLQVYKSRKLPHILTEPLIENHLKVQTLNAMWSVIDKYKKPFTNYLKGKAKMYGDTKMQSYNFWAPIGESKQKLSYEEAVDFILESFSRFGNELGDFARQAFDKGWVEAENRTNKSTAGFCANFPLTGESRVFMTYEEGITNVLTLAHELGHAFHNDAMKTVDGINRQYPLSIAETASFFAEQTLLDAVLEKAESKEEKLFLLDEKLKRSVMNFMNIHSRFLFEKNFYEERKNGRLSAERLNELMQEAFDVAYDGSFDNPSLRSWIWTPHYYITTSPFYNFPYTFGYFFALSLYAKSKEKGKSFEKDYIALLRDSGSMSIEDLVMKHLGEDITSKDFWENGIKLCVKDVEEFMSLVS